MSTVPDINLMREMAQEKNDAFNEEFAKSELFSKMCVEIQEAANKGNFTRLFEANCYGGHKSLLAAHNLFLQHGYSVKVQGFTLLVSWGRVSEQE